jgi:hypothetical protein
MVSGSLSHFFLLLLYARFNGTSFYEHKGKSLVTLAYQKESQKRKVGSKSPLPSLSFAIPKLLCDN